MSLVCVYASQVTPFRSKEVHEVNEIKYWELEYGVHDLMQEETIMFPYCVLLYLL